MVTVLLIDAGQGGLDAVALSKVVSVTDGKVMEAELDPVPDQVLPPSVLASHAMLPPLCPWSVAEKEVPGQIRPPTRLPATGTGLMAIAFVVLWPFDV
jgi:hypothetical protein